MKRLHIIAAAYAAAGILTFGHAAASRQAEEAAEYAACKAEPERLCFKSNELAPMAGLLAAPLWPLYWSWEAWS